MRWLKPNLRSSIYGLLGSPIAPSESMLALLGEAGLKHFPQITRRIRYASDVQALWYLRGDLMAALASIHGEMAARQRIASVTQMFNGLLPGSLTSRPSPLVG
jgi:hypothetical protein